MNKSKKKEYEGYCRSCFKKISEAEYDKYNNYCKNCYENIDEIVEDNDYNDEDSYRIKNPIARIIKFLAIFEIIAGIILGFLQFNSYEETLGGIYIAVSIISAIFVYAIGEIIQLLEDIKNK